LNGSPGALVAVWGALSFLSYGNDKGKGNGS
jgi:hypothetical protein